MMIIHTSHGIRYSIFAVVATVHVDTSHGIRAPVSIRQKSKSDRRHVIKYGWPPFVSRFIVRWRWSECFSQCIRLQDLQWATLAVWNTKWLLFSVFHPLGVSDHSSPLLSSPPALQSLPLSLFLPFSVNFIIAVRFGYDSMMKMK